MSLEAWATKHDFAQMDSQASLSQASQASLVPASDPSQPTTPQNRRASISEPSSSPSPSKMPLALTPTQPERAKFSSPAPPTASSMTPPPSSQIPTTRAVIRTPTPPTPQLSSPPPTLKNQNQLGNLGDSSATLFTPEQISNAPADELRSMVNELTVALRDVRMSAAHYKLQYNMLCIDSRETSNRMAVELAMAQREVDVLQQAEERRRSSMVSPAQSLHETTVNPANAILMNEMNRHCQILQNENDELRDMLDQQKRLTEHKEGEIAGLLEENERLRGRIRKNRDHIAPFLPLLEQMNDQSPPRSSLGTPHHATPRNRGHGRVPPPVVDSNNRREQPFEALLLADKMLSQETSTAPSTPTKSQPPKQRFGHTRGTHSMSSLPQTPNRSRPIHGNPTLLRTPPTFSAINAIPQSAPPAQFPLKHVRRESSNSTITASSVDGEDAFSDRDEIPESQASQMATSMLRRTTQQKPKMPASSLHDRVPSGLIQTKIFGHVRKAGVSRPGEHEKRRLSVNDNQGSPTKRGRLNDAVGLGIGGLIRH